jgi:hypothetical protein
VVSDVAAWRPTAMQATASKATKEAKIFFITAFVLLLFAYKCRYQKKVNRLTRDTVK